MRRVIAAAAVTVPIFIVALIAGLILTCGDPDSAMPDPGPCPSPSPTPIVPSSRRDPLGAYRQAINQNVSRLDTLTTGFRQKYPDGKFSRNSNFRSDFARYADETVCIAIYLRDLTLPSDLAAVEAAFDRALDDFVAHQRAGREAVRARNVSAYRDWFADIEVRLAALRRVATVVPRLPG